MRWLFQRAQASLASPARHPRLTVAIGRLLGVAFLVCFATGLYSHFIQDPLPWMYFPNRPTWLYRVTQGVHVATGIACIPLLLGKLYTVYPLLFKFPPLKGLLSFLERASITIFVAASLLQLFTGLWNTYHWYVWPFPFRQVHYALSYVIIASLIIHIGVKLPIIRRWWFKANSVDERGDYLPVGPGEGELRGAEREQARGITGMVQRLLDGPAKPSPKLSRRTVVGAVAGGAALVTLTTVGESLTLLAPLDVFGARKPGVGPQRLSVNKTAREARVTDQATNPNWRLTIKNGDRTRSFSLAELQRMKQTTVKLPIACVEGWSQQAIWTGVRVKDLAALVGADSRDLIFQSLQRGSYGRTILERNFVQDPLSLIALKVNGETLSLDHGYPARLIAPARPGVLQTKWLDYLEAK